ncbi:MAG: hypothetical protein ABI203_09060, partial [Mucilaginibacter sp.]
LHHRYADPILILAFVVAFIPVVSVIVIIFRGIFNTGSINTTMGSTVLIIWLCAIGFLTFYIVKVTQNFREQASFTETIKLNPTVDNTYYIKLNDLKYFTAQDSTRLNIKGLFHNDNVQVMDEDDNRGYNHVNLSIEKSDINQPVLVESYSARGRNYDDALFNAHNAKYIFAQKDSVLTLDYKMRNDADQTWHSEEIYLTLKLPINAKVIIDRALDRISNVRVWNCNNMNKKDNDKVHSATFMMTDNGLQCKVDTLVTDTLKKSPDSLKKVSR